VRLELTEERSGVLAAEWLAESVRVTAFLTTQKVPVPIWESLLGRAPIQVNERPADNIRVEAGDFGAGLLLAMQHPGRIDLVYSPKNDGTSLVPGPNPPDLVHIGPAASAISALLTVIDGMPDIFSESFRIAFAPAFVRAGKNNADINSYIATAAGIHLSDAETDVMWQVNKPIQAKSFNGTINRVLRCQSVLVQQIPVLLGTMSQSLAATMQTVRYARVELDVNTGIEQHENSGFNEPLAVLREILDSAIPLLIGKAG